MSSLIQRGKQSPRALVARVALLAAPFLAVACSKETPPPPPLPQCPAAAPAAEAVPASFRVCFETSAGKIVIQVNRAWSPRGADRFYQLVTDGYFTDARFFRVVPGFVAQFGMHADPAVNKKWADSVFLDDPVAHSNMKGTISFATRGPNTRSNQLFINLANNGNLDGMGFSPIGEVVEGIDVVDQLHDGYGEAPDQGEIGARGNAYLQRAFPNLDYIRTATIIGG